MGQSQRKKSSHLSLVQEPAQEQVLVKYGELGREELSLEQRDILDSYLELCGSKGTLAGVQLGRQNWDIRPLIIENSKLVIYRFTDPALSLDHSAVLDFRSLLSKLHSRNTVLGAGLLASGQARSQIWVKRVFFKELLSPDTIANGSERAVQICFQTISQLEELHRHGIVHGHIVPANIGLEGAKAYLLDTGFHHIRSIDTALDSTDLCVEKPISTETDILALIQFAVRLLGNKLNQPQLNTLQAIQLGDLPLPTAKQLRHELFSHKPAYSETHSISAEKSLTLRRGRLLNQNRKPVEKVSTANEDLPANNSEVDSRSEQTASPVSKDIDYLDNSSNILTADHPGNAQVPRPFSINVGSNSSLAVILVVAFACVYMLIDQRESLSNATAALWGAEQIESGQLAEYQSYWQSGQNSLMNRVAQDALKGSVNNAAEITIIRTALKGEVISNVRNDLLRISFNPLWERSLSEQDRRTALALALVKIYPSAKRHLGPLSKTHPAILLAIASGVTSKEPPTVFEEIGLSRMQQLPGAYGKAYSDLSEQGITTLADPVAVALAHILTIDRSRATLSTFLQSEPAQRLRLLYPLYDQIPDLATKTWNTMLRNELHSKQVHWFKREPAAGWLDLPKTVLLGLMAGVFPEHELPFQHMTDLIRFPDKGIAKKAQRQLTDKYELHRDTLSVLADRQLQLSRAQALGLVTALTLSDKTKALALFQAWFKSNPSPLTVLKLLVSRVSITSPGAFSGEAVAYLENKELPISLTTLRKLSNHRDVSVRVFAYTRLNVDNAAERELLQSMALLEPVERVRTQLKEQLELLALGSQLEVAE